MEGAPAWAVKLLEAHATTQLAFANVATLLVTSIHATQQLLAALVASEEPDAPAAPAKAEEAAQVDWEGKALDPAGQYQHVAGKGLVRVD